MKFWDVIKEISTEPVQKEAARLFVLGLAGDPESVARARAIALGPNPSPDCVEAAAAYLCVASPPYPEAVEKRLRYADLLVSLPGGPAITELRPADTLRLQNPEDLIPAVLARRPDLWVALGRRLPGFRPLASEQVVRNISRVNAEFAAVAGISAAVPWLAPIFPAVAGTDILMLTKNQVFMVLRLAAIHGAEPELLKHTGEVAGVIGGAFGWRTLARELASVLPGPLGFPIRLGIAYTGTYGVGKAAQMVFDKGRRPTRAEMRRIYEDASRLAKETAARLLPRIRQREEVLALPEPREELLADELSAAAPEAAPTAAEPAKTGD